MNNEAKKMVKSEVGRIHNFQVLSAPSEYYGRGKWSTSIEVD